MLRELANDFFHLFFPRLCASCDRSLIADENILCLDCMYHLPFTDFHEDPNNETARQLWGKIDFVHAFSMLHLAKSSRVEVLLHRLKYKKKPEIGHLLGELYARRIQSLLADIDGIIPIPIHQSKLHKRGYNQAAEFARGLSQGLEKDLEENLLVRHLLSPSQVQKSRTERYDNVKGVFGLAKNKSLAGKYILLVDDVLTTGATLCEAGKLLIEAGAKISIATIARA